MHYTGIDNLLKINEDVIGILVKNLIHSSKVNNKSEKFSEAICNIIMHLIDNRYLGYVDWQKH